MSKSGRPHHEAPAGRSEPIAAAAPAPGSGGAVATRREAPIPSPSPRVVLVILATVLLAFLLHLGREALSPFVVGLLLVYLLNPPVERLHRLGVPRWASVLLVYVLVVFVLVQAVSIMIRPLVEQIRTFTTDLPSLLTRVQGYYQGLDLPAPLRQAVDEWIAGLGQGEGGLDPTVLLPVVNMTAGFVSGIFGYLIIPVWAFYLLKDRPRLAASFDRMLPSNWRADAWAVIAIIQRVFGQWIRAQLFLGITVGIATFIGLEILNFVVDPVFGRFALLLAVSAGVLELLPIIGPIIAAVPAVLLALTAGPQAAIAALLLYLLVQQIENNVLVPKIQGDAVELHPSAVMFALVIGGAIAGLLGAILSLPVTAAGRDLYRYLFRRASDERPDEALDAVMKREKEPASDGPDARQPTAPAGATGGAGR